jgi:hypothetical protein
VNEYFAPRAKKRWCVSLYGSGGQQPTGVFQQVSIELGSIFSSRLLNFLCNTVVFVSFPTVIIHFLLTPFANFGKILLTPWIGLVPKFFRDSKCAVLI